MDLAGRLQQLEEMVREAKSMPLSSSALLNRDEVLDMLKDMQETLPEEIKQARWIVKDREDLLGKARQDAERIVEQAKEDQLRMARKEEVVHRAEEEADRIVAEAEQQAMDARAEAESYVDARLAQFEIALAQDPRGGAVHDARAGQDARPGGGRARPTPRPDDRRGAGVRHRAGGPAVRRGGGPMTIEPIDVRDLIGHPGVSRLSHVGGTLEGLGTEVATLKPDELVHGDLLLESVVEGILVTGHLDGTFALRCARCLKEFEQPVRVDVHELFSTSPEVDDDDVYPLDAEGWLDPEQMVRDALGLELPFSPLHSPDCLGLCSVCGGDRNLGECPGDHPEIDPRWADLELVLHEAGRPELNASEDVSEGRGRKEHHGRPQEEAEQDAERQARRELEERGAAVRGMPAVPSAEAASSRVQQLRLLRRPAGRRGRVTS